MKIAVVYFSRSSHGRLVDISRGLARGIEAQGHQVDLIDGDRDIHAKLTIYGYIAVGVSAESLLGGKITGNLSRFLSNSGIVAGKRSFAFISKYGLRQMKTLSGVMGIMESEGMFIKYSEILSDEEHAFAIGKRLLIN